MRDQNKGVSARRSSSPIRSWNSGTSRTACTTKAIEAIDDDAWTAVHYPGAVEDPDTGPLISDAEVAETSYTMTVRGRGRVTARLVVRRVRRRQLPGRAVPGVSVDLLARRAVVHRRGELAYVVGCSLRVHGLYAPVVYDGSLHVDGGVLDNLPVTALAGQEGPLIAVSIGTGRERRPASATMPANAPRVPNVVDTLMRTMTIGSAMASSAVLEQADLAIHPDTSSIGFLEWHQIDQAREAGRNAAREALPQIIELVQR